MRSSFILGVGAIALIGAAIAVPSQEEPTAEKAFKNIQSFKGEKASAVLPAMQFMCSALKVDCSFCHEEDRSADTKEEKRTAREMIAMQKDINAKYFGGHTEVTCATCHAGKTHPMPLPPVMGVEVRPRRSNDVKPADVLAAYEKAVGTAKPGALTLTGKTKFFNQDVTIAATYADGKYLISDHGAMGDIKTGFDGTATWFSMPKENIKLPPDVGARFNRTNFVYTGPASLPQLTNPIGATAKIADRDQLVVSGVVSGEKGRASFYFDKQTGLLTRAMLSYPTIIGSDVDIIDYANYKRVSGVQIPMKISIHSEGQDTDRVFSSAKMDSKVDSAIFSQPQ